MDNIIKFLKSLSGEDLVTLIGILVTLVISLITLIISINNSRKSNYINTVTEKRVEWINKLRNLVAQYISMTDIDKIVYHTGDIKENEKGMEYISSYSQICQEIKLLLNFSDKLDNEIIKQIESINKLTDDFYRDSFKCDIDEYGFIRETIDMHINAQYIVKLRNEFVENMQVYLKAEWNRVKYESQGKIYDKKIQEYDIDELKNIQKDINYKTSQWKRFKYCCKVKKNRIIYSPKFIVSSIITLIIMIIIFSILLFNIIL